MPHNPLGPVSTAACLHFDLSTPLFAVQELTWRPGVLARWSDRHAPRGGNLYSGGSPGLGVELDEEAARAVPFQLGGMRALHREDGLGLGLVKPVSQGGAMTNNGYSLTFEEFDQLFEKLKNWGRWGDDDERGTLNFLGEAEVVEAVKLVKTGRRVSLGRPLRHRGRSRQRPPGAALHDAYGR